MPLELHSREALLAYMDESALVVYALQGSEHDQANSMSNTLWFEVCHAAEHTHLGDGVVIELSGWLLQCTDCHQAPIIAPALSLGNS